MYKIVSAGSKKYDLFLSKLLSVSTYKHLKRLYPHDNGKIWIDSKMLVFGLFVLILNFLSHRFFPLSKPFHMLSTARIMPKYLSSYLQLSIVLSPVIKEIFLCNRWRPSQRTTTNQIAEWWSLFPTDTSTTQLLPLRT